MKLIIDIPDEYYKFFRDLQYYSSGRRSGRTIERNVINAIKNGTPYNPSNDLISREALKEAVKNRFDNSEYFPFHFLALIDNAQPVDAIVNTIEVRTKGEWKTVKGIDGDEYYECSNCGEPWVLMAGTPKDNNMNFCPNCGADMRKGGAE